MALSCDLECTLMVLSVCPGGGGGGGREERCLSVELESDLSVYACALTRVCQSLHYCVH